MAAGIVLAVACAAGAAAQPAPWRVVQASDGTLYVLAAGQRFTLEPDAISDDDLAQYTDGGDLGSSLPSPASGQAPAPQPQVVSSPVPTSVAVVPLAVPSPGLAAGSRANPVPMGTPVTLSDNWQLVVLSTQPDATTDRPAQTGSQFFLASVRVTNGAATAQPFRADVRLRATGTSSTPYLAFANACGTIPSPLPDTDVAPGGSVTGNVCWAVQSNDATALVLYESPPLQDSSSAVTRVYLALHR